MHKKLLLAVLFITFSCQYFNAFFNAEESFEAGIADLRKIDSRLSDKSRVFPYSDLVKPSSGAVKNLELSIKRSWKLIELYTDSADYADDAFFLIGRSHFFLGNYDKSIEVFSDLIDNYSERVIAAETCSYF